MCLFSLSWYTCGFYTWCHAAGGPSGVPLLADSGAGLLFGVAGRGLLRLFPQCLCAVFPAGRYIGFSGLLLLRLLAGVVVALHPVSGCSSCGVVCLVCRWGSLAAFSLP